MWPVRMPWAGQQHDGDAGDAFAVLKVHTARGSAVAEASSKLNNVKWLVKLLSAVGGSRDCNGKYLPLRSEDASSTRKGPPGPLAWTRASFEPSSNGMKAPAWLPAARAANTKPARAQQQVLKQSIKAVAREDKLVAQLLLSDIPPAAACLIYQRLSKSSRRALLLSSKELRALFCCAVRVLHLSGSDLKRCGVEQLSRLPLLFPELSELHLQLGNDTDLLLALRQLTRSPSSSHISSSSRKQHLRHLRAFSLDSRLRGDAFQALAKFLAQQQGLAKLLLPHQRCSGPNDQRALAGLLEALPGLTHLELGYSAAAAGSSTSSSRAGRVSDSSTSSSGGSRAARISDSSMSSSSGGTPKYAAYAASSSAAAAAAAGGQAAASNAVCSSVFRRIVRLQGLRVLSCNLSNIPDVQLEALSTLRSLQELRISAAGRTAGLAAALQGLSRLSSLELQHPSVCGELQGCFGGLQQLQVLALGLCPKLTDGIMPEVAQLRQLEKLTLPFPLSAPHLRLLSHLPNLQELYSWRQIELDVLGPAHEPLLRVMRLVTGSINGHGKSLAAWFPNVETLCLKHCSDLAALSLRGCVSLQELLAGECGQLSNEGFACLRGLKALQRLQMEGANQLTDAAFSAVFSSTMPALQQVNIAGCPNITDAALQLLTASCRRLTSISISSCRQLTDKTLKRLAHCEHLNGVVLKGCRGFTAEGVAALAAAPQMRQVCVNGCMGVRSSLCKGYRAGVKVRVEDRL